MADDFDVEGGNIAIATKIFEATGNVAAAWLAFSIAFQHGREIPESVFKEIERFAATVAVRATKAIVAEVGDEPVTLTPEELAAFWRGKDKRDPVGRFQKEWRDYHLYWGLRKRVDQGMTLAAAAKEVREMPGVGLSERSLEKLWARLNPDGR